MRCTECNEGRMNAGKETRYSGGIVILGSCLRLIGVLAVLAGCLAIIFKVGTFVRPELLEGYPPKAELVRQWIRVTIILGVGIMLLGGRLCRKRKILTCGNCERVISGGSDTPLLLRLVSIALLLAFLGFGGYQMAVLVLHLDLPRYQEQTSAVWNEKLGNEFDAWVAAQPEAGSKVSGWSGRYEGTVAEELETGGAPAKAVLKHISEHGGTPAAAILLGRMKASKPDEAVPDEGK